ncbi:MAG: transglutaminase family protein [Pseudomonadota bacterium]
MVLRSLIISLASLAWSLAALANVSRPDLPESGDLSDTLETLLSVPEDEIDLTWSKLVVDSLIDPEADIEDTYATINAMALAVSYLAGPDASAAQHVATLRAYIYQAGPWNGDQPFDYDFDDPMGLSASHKSLHRYLTTKKGNCINMPFLFLAIGEQLGVEMNATTAPRHVFIQFEDPATGEVQHLETTSGAMPQRLVWQRQIMPMSDRAIESGMYFQRLSKRQQVALMGEAFLHLAGEQSDHEEILELTDFILDVFPQSDNALLHRMQASRHLIRSEILPRYNSPDVMRPDVIGQFNEWAVLHDTAIDALSQNGWQPYVQTEHVVTPGEGRPK